MYFYLQLDKVPDKCLSDNIKLKRERERERLAGDMIPLNDNVKAQGR